MHKEKPHLMTGSKHFFRLLGFLAAVGFSLSAQAENTPVRVLQLNVWQEGTIVPGGADGIAQAIKASGAQIVFLEEIRNYDGRRFIPELAGKLSAIGVDYYYTDGNSDCGILSVWPVSGWEEYQGPGSVHKNVIAAGKKVITVYAAHLDYTHYACYLPRGYDGVTWEKLDNPVTDTETILAQNNASGRLAALNNLIKDARNEIAKGREVIICGDFNEPSDADWTEATAHTAGHNGAVVKWPCSAALTESGFKDAYRTVHPDPLTHPGYTYPSDNKAVPESKLTWAPESDERDRIDFVWYYPYGNLTVNKASVFGPSSSIVKGRRVQENSDDHFITPDCTWPSDHKGVIADFTLVDGNHDGNNAEPAENAGILHISKEDNVFRKDIRLLAVTDSDNGRGKLLLKASLDGGMRWKDINSITIETEGTCGYPSLSLIDAENVGLVYKDNGRNGNSRSVSLKDIVKEVEARPFGLPEIWSDGMVVQRDKPVRIEGMTSAGSRITVQFAGRKRSVKAGPDGKWTVTLPEVKAGAEYSMILKSKAEELTINDIAAGEVWVCSGQSNMEFRLSGCDTFEKDLESSEDAQLRLFNIKSPLVTYGVEWTEEQTDKVNCFDYYAPCSWQKSGRKSAAEFSAVAWHFGKILRDSLKVPVGLICNAVGGTTTESWCPMQAIRDSIPEFADNWENCPKVMEWARGRAIQNMRASRSPVINHPFKPAYLFNAGIMPLAHFPVRGAVWYQGESNAEDIGSHEVLFRTLVTSWRNWWNDSRMPFYFVQLSSIERPTWPEFRDSKRRLACQIPYCGMAVSSDHGDRRDVHPKAKKPVGERLALLALEETYGYQLNGHSPEAVSAEYKNGCVEIDFRYAGGLKTSDGETLRGFFIQHADGSVAVAEAVITGPDTVTVKVSGEKPAQVLYGWEPYTDANLTGPEGLPVSTFRIEIK